MPHYAIRPAREDDVPTVVEMGRRLHADSNFKDLAFHTEYAERHVRRLLSDDECCLLLAVDSRRTIGLISGEVTQAMFGPELIASEDLFYVEPDMRGAKCGVSANLLRDFCMWAAENGAARISVANVAGTDDEKFKRLLGTYGFQRAGSVMFMEIG